MPPRIRAALAVLRTFTPPSTAQRDLRLQSLHVVGIDLQGLLPREVWVCLLLDEEVLDGAGTDSCQDLGIVGGAATELRSGRRIVDRGVAGARREVLDVQHLDTVGVGAEVVLGAAAADRDPAAVELHDDQLGIGLLEQQVVRDCAVLRSEFHGVVVVAELEAGGLGLGAPCVELVGVPLPVVVRERGDLLCEGQAGALPVSRKPGKEQMRNWVRCFAEASPSF